MEDPTENVQELFVQLDKKFFQSNMNKNGVILEWNEKSSSSAGYCYQLDDAVKKTKRCYIVLNKPLLMLRKREDLVDTLLVIKRRYFRFFGTTKKTFFLFFLRCPSTR